MRKYIAILSNAKNKISIVFNSKYKANSKNNYNDCKKTLINKYGYDFTYNYKIEYTTLFII